MSPYTFIFLISLVLAGCGMDENVNTSIVEGEAGGSISVYVSEGDSKTRPIYSWSDGGDNTAMSVTVALASDIERPIWTLQSLPPENENIRSPVIHGLTQPGTTPDPGVDLLTDILYRVTVRKLPPGPSGYREFRIKP